MRRIPAILLCLTLQSAVTAALAQNGEIFQAGEELTYAVRWNFIRLGTIVIRTAADSADTGLVHATMTVESAPGLPFISISEVNRCLLSRSNAKALRYSGDHRNGDRAVSIRYSYDPGSKVLLCSETDAVRRTVVRQDTLLDVPPFVEGTALFFYSRWRSASKASYRVPTVVNGKLAFTYLTFTDEKEEMEIDAFAYPVTVRKYWGQADWSGGSSAGLTGGFTGWITDDGAAVPLRAEMKIALGSITIELERWHRDGWVPPGPAQARLQVDTDN